ncbi:hypothetical protein AV530_007610 [Patagioenas fasciata monilis]|uniref:Uncharacterized protein n=1 Tax=Patagioenas fasciata monilis TaxID=372326 RepID=A0A1V4JYE5_PATFA|nr:hypothetical protein AV530_007610 [Patagioenas fasciata monilis]
MFVQVTLAPAEAIGRWVQQEVEVTWTSYTCTGNWDRCWERSTWILEKQLSSSLTDLHYIDSMSASVKRRENKNMAKMDYWDFTQRRILSCPVKFQGKQVPVPLVWLLANGFVFSKDNLPGENSDKPDLLSR